MTEFLLDRRQAVPAVLGRHEDFLIISGLAGASRDIAGLTDDGDHVFALGGAMGAAVTMGLGLALARPDRQVLVVTGDGELLMNLGGLATVALMRPANLSILCVDNGHYGETGYQRTHTYFGADLAMVARGCGIDQTITVTHPEDLDAGARLLRQPDLTFVLLRVAATEAMNYMRSFNAIERRVRFRLALNS
jgi:phosphonopyruvate decarboxylase